MNKSKENQRKSAWFYVAIIVGMVLIYLVLVQLSSSNSFNNRNSELNNYRDLLNNDIEKIEGIIDNECNNPQTYTEINECISAANPRLEAYQLHLTEARSFLQANSQIFSNRLELQQDIDDQLVWAAGAQIKLTNAINEYNTNIQAQQNQQEALLELLRILALGI